MKGIHDALRKKEAQIATLQREVKVLRTAATIVEANRRRSPSKGDTSVPSQPQMIRDVLLAHGGSLHVDKIARAIEKRFKVKLKRSDITSVIYRAIRGRKLFRKAGINTFALLEWPATTAGRRTRSVGSRVRDKRNSSIKIDKQR
jgi:hypothetical protein